jgi:hypothetical protein
MFFLSDCPIGMPDLPSPTRDGNPCALCSRLKMPEVVRSAVFLSYTWGHSRSPAYAFKTRKNFDEDLRQVIASWFGWMAHGRYRHLSDAACVIGAPPRRTKQWGLHDHLNDLLLAVEQVNFQVVRDVFAYEDDRIVIADAGAAQALRGRPIILVDNLMKSGSATRRVAAKLREIGAGELHLCMMARWIEGCQGAVNAAEEYRSTICRDPQEIDEWYRSVFCDASI